MQVPVLRGERIVVRPFRSSDVDAFVGYRSDPEIARFQGWDGGYTRALGERFVAAAHRENGLLTVGEWCQLAVADGESDALLGDVALRPDEDDPRGVEIGYTLGAAHHGHGYVTEALTVVLDWLFTVGGVHRVHARTDARNDASVRVLERLGFRDEGRGREAIATTDEATGRVRWVDERRFGLLEREWPP